MDLVSYLFFLLNKFSKRIENPEKISSQNREYIRINGCISIKIRRTVCVFFSFLFLLLKLRFSLNIKREQRKKISHLSPPTFKLVENSFLLSTNGYFQRPHEEREHIFYSNHHIEGKGSRYERGAKKLNFRRPFAYFCSFRICLLIQEVNYHVYLRSDALVSGLFSQVCICTPCTEKAWTCLVISFQ